MLLSFSGFFFISQTEATNEQIKPISPKDFVTPPINKTWGTNLFEEGISIAMDTSENVYLCGVQRGSVVDPVKLILLKYTPSLDLLWNKSLTLSNDCEITDMIIDSSNNIYVSGENYIATIPYPFLYKLDASGSLLWNSTQAQIPFFSFVSIALDSNENPIVTSYDGYNYGIFVAKFAASTGNRVWNETYHLPNHEFGPRDITINTNDNIFVTGMVLPANGTQNIILVKFDATGNYLANHTLTGPVDEDIGTSIVASSSNIYVGGFRGSYATNGMLDAFIAKYDFSCTLLWNKSYNYEGSGTLENPSSITLTQSDTIVLCGFDQGGDIGWVVEFDAMGTQLWDYKDNISSLTYLDACVGSSNNLFISGSVFNASNLSEDILLLKFGAKSVQDDAGSGGDAGDNYNDAVPVLPGNYSGSLPSGDSEDYYQFSANVGDLIEITLTADPGTDFDIWLTNPSLQQVASSVEFAYPEVITYTANETGDWYVVVTSFSGEGDYNLTITVTPPATTTPPSTTTPPPSTTTPPPSTTSPTNPTSSTETIFTLLGLSWIIWAIIVGIAVFVIIVIVVVVVSRKKKE